MDKNSYEVIDLSRGSDELQLLQHQFSEMPHLILLPQLPLPDLQNLIDKLSALFLERGLSALSPYPTYLVTSALVHSPIIPLLSRVELFPKHFLRSRSDKAQGKENLPQKKMEIQKEKLKNMDPNKYLLETPLGSSASKELLRLSRLYEFYSDIYHALRD